MAPKKALPAKRGADVLDDSITVQEYLQQQCDAAVEKLTRHNQMLAQQLQQQFEEVQRELRCEADAREKSERDEKKAAALNAPTAIVLEVDDGPHSGKTFTLHPSEEVPCFVGRSTGRKFRTDGISLPKDSEVSTTHGRFQLSGSTVVFVDTGSTNGSFLNGAELNALAESVLSSGDRLQIGSTVLVVKSVICATSTSSDEQRGAVANAR